MADTVLELKDSKGKVIATEVATSPAQIVRLKWQGYSVYEEPSEAEAQTPPGRVNRTSTTA